METTIVYWGYIGIIENKMETTIRGLYICIYLYCTHSQTVNAWGGQYPAQIR